MYSGVHSELSNTAIRMYIHVHVDLRPLAPGRSIPVSHYFRSGEPGWSNQTIQRVVDYGTVNSHLFKEFWTRGFIDWEMTIFRTLWFLLTVFCQLELNNSRIVFCKSKKPETPPFLSIKNEFNFRQFSIVCHKVNSYPLALMASSVSTQNTQKVPLLTDRLSVRLSTAVFSQNRTRKQWATGLGLFDTHPVFSHNFGSGGAIEGSRVKSPAQGNPGAWI